MIRPDIHFEEIDTETAQRLGLQPRQFADATGHETVGLVQVTDVWLEVRLGGWIAAYRMIGTDENRLQVGEVRLVPDEGDGGERPGTGDATWLGVHAPAIPPLRVEHLRKLRVAPHVDQLRELLQMIAKVSGGTRRQALEVEFEPEDGWNRDMHFPLPDAGEAPVPSSSVDEEPVHDVSALHPEETPTVIAAPKKRRARRPKYSDWEVAQFAADYIAAVERGVPAIREIANAYGIKPMTARNLIARARAIGMLVGSHRGRQGGILSAKAQQLLQEEAPRPSRLRRKPARRARRAKNGKTRRGQ